MAKTEIPAGNIELLFSITITVTSLRDAGRLLEHIKALPDFDDHVEIEARTSGADGDDGTEFGVDLEDQDKEPEQAEQYVDSDGTTFDPALHAWNKEKKEPSYTSAGRFRKKRKDAETKEPHKPRDEAPAGDTDPAPAEESAPDVEADDENQDPADLDPEKYSNVLKSVLSNVNQAKSGTSLNRIENHPVIEQLKGAEREIALEAIRMRASELIAGDDCD